MAAIDGVKMRVPVAPARGSLCDALETLLDTGVVIAGEITIKVADVELLYVGLELVACSTETAGRVVELPPVVGGGARSASRSPDS